MGRCKNRCKYCLKEIGFGFEHTEMTCARRYIGDNGSHNMAVMRDAILEENFPALDMTRDVEEVQRQVDMRRQGVWRQAGVELAKETAAWVDGECRTKVEVGTPLVVEDMR